MSVTTILGLMKTKALTAEQADTAPETMRMACEASAMPGDLVRQDLTTENKVLVVTSNTIETPVIGMIKAKISATYCSIYVRGVIAHTGLGIGRMWLSTSGTMTITRPVTGNLQLLGYSYGNDTIHLDPALSLTALTG